MAITHDKVVDMLLKKTGTGSVVQWNERIANIAASNDVVLEDVDWVGPPRVVASRVVLYIHRHEDTYEHLWEFLEKL